MKKSKDVVKKALEEILKTVSLQCSTSNIDLDSILLRCNCCFEDDDGNDVCDIEQAVAFLLAELAELLDERLSVSYSSFGKGLGI